MKYVIGIDEVGRGALAGPVTVAAVAMPHNLKLITNNLQPKLRDSKKLTAKYREIWARFLKSQPEIFYACASVTPGVIDKINISRAANLAATRAVTKLITNNKLLITNPKVFLDGGLYINSKVKSQKSKLQFKSLEVRTIIRGDEKVPSIMAASILAKVKRDRYMKKLNKKWPGYNFDVHKGYGTKKHFSLVRANGVSSVHRRSFLKKFD